MRTVNALFVGIDDYPDRPLLGCVNDVTAAEDWLRRQDGLRPDILRLYDGQATRATVADAIRTHLGRSGPGDTALLWFSGHGSEHDTDDPRAATGRSQALVCHDSLDQGGQPLLLDTELGALLDAIARTGAHVLAVLDCCHSGGATRETVPGVRARGVTWRPWWRTESAGRARAGGGLRESGGPGPEPDRHVLLAACRPQELAHEADVDGQIHGRFSHCLLRALDHPDPLVTYGGLHALVEERVHRAHWNQHPELRGPHNGRFLRGDPLPAAPFLLRHTEPDGWEVNCGQAHGLRARGAEFTLLADDGTPQAAPPRVFEVREVRPETALVEPVGPWPGPDDPTGPGHTDTVHGVTPTALAFPPATVTLSGPPEAVRMLATAVDSAPLLTTTAGDGLPLHVAAAGGLAQVSGADGHPLEPLPLRSDTDAARVADCLAHLARWHQLRDLTNPDPSLSSLVRITVDPLVGDVRTTATGERVCAYTRDRQEPQVRVRIHNDWDRPLWCVLIDLTDSYGASPHLYEGDFVGPGRAGIARHGEPVWLRLPPKREVEPGAFTRDWLKVIVTENELNTAPFLLPAWSPDLPAAGRGGTSAAGGGGLVRLAPRQDARDAGGPARGVGRWGTATVTLRTEVP